MAAGIVREGKWVNGEIPQRVQEEIGAMERTCSRVRTRKQRDRRIGTRGRRSNAKSQDGGPPLRAGRRIEASIFRNWSLALLPFRLQ